MAGPTIAHAEVLVDLDGKRIPEEARGVGREAGQEMGDAHNKAYGDKLDKGLDDFRDRMETSMERSGQLSGESFTDGFEKSLKANKGRLAAEAESLATSPYKAQAAAHREAFNDMAADFDRDDKIRQRWVDQADLNHREFTRSIDQMAADATSRIDRMTAEIESDFERRHGPAIDRAAARTKELGESIEAAAQAAGRSRAPLAGFLDRVEAYVNGPAAERLPKANVDLVGFGRAARLSAEAANDGRASLSGFLGKLEDFVDGPGGRRLPQTARGLDAFGQGVRSLERNVGNVGGALARAATGFTRVASGAEKAGGAAGGALPNLKSMFSAFSNFDPGDNLGQLLLLIIALLPQIAVLASAAAGGLLILGGAAGAGVLALGGLVLAFKDVLKPVDNFPASVRPTISAIQDLVGSMELVNKKMQFVPGKIGAISEALKTRVFAGLADDIKRVTDVAVPAFVVGAKVLGDSLNQVIRGFAQDLGSSDFAKNIKDIFTGVGPVIVDLGNIARNVFGIIGQLFIDALPSVHQFTSELAAATGKFLEFLKTPEGKDAVKQFLEDSKRTLKEVGDAAVVVGRALAGLVTPKNIENTAVILQQLADSGPGIAKFANDLNEAIVLIGGLVEVIGGVAGAIGGFFDGLFSAGDTFLVTLSNLFSGIGIIVKGAVEGIGQAFSGIGQAFQQAASGNFLGAAKSIQSSLLGTQKIAESAMNGLGVAINNGAAKFQSLDAASQTALINLASRFDVPASKAQEFGGKIASLAAAAGISIGDIANARGWGDLQAKTGAASGTIDDLKKQFGTLPKDVSTDVKVSGAKESAAQVKDFQSQINNLVGKLVNVKEDGSVASKKRVADLKSQISALVAKTVPVKEDGSAASKKRVQDLRSQISGLVGKLVAVKEAGASDSSSRVKSLKSQISALVGKAVRVDENGAAAARGRVEGLAASIRNLSGKTINISEVTTRYSKAGGTLHAGGGIIGPYGAITGGTPRQFAAGGILNNPTYLAGGNVLAGEAGPEALVPLTGALAKIDPSVRGLAAAARGLTDAVSTGPVFQAGAIVVQTVATDPYIVASQVYDRLVPVGG